METYFVALVYRKEEFSQIITILRTLILDAENDSDAFDKTVEFFKEETVGFELILKAATTKQ